MNGQVANKNSALENIKRELNMLRSIVIGKMVQDEEGKYNPRFVRRVLKAADKEPDLKFTGKDLFIQQLQKRG